MSRRKRQTGSRLSGPNWLESIVLRDQRDGNGLRYLAAKRRTGGGIVIEGQDLGPGVERAWGEGNRGLYPS